MANRKRFRDLDPKEKVSYGAAGISLLVGFGLTIAAFFLDPAGEIHDSVLWTLGQCLAFAGAILGVGVYTTGAVRGMKREINRFMRDPNNRRAFEEDVFPEEDDEEDDDDVVQ